MNPLALILFMFWKSKNTYSSLFPKWRTTSVHSTVGGHINYQRLFCTQPSATFSVCVLGLRAPSLSPVSSGLENLVSRRWKYREEWQQAWREKIERKDSWRGERISMTTYYFTQFINSVSLFAKNYFDLEFRCKGESPGGSLYLFSLSTHTP